MLMFSGMLMSLPLSGYGSSKSEITNDKSRIPETQGINNRVNPRPNSMGYLVKCELLSMGVRVQDFEDRLINIREFDRDVSGGFLDKAKAKAIALRIEHEIKRQDRKKFNSLKKCIKKELKNRGVKRLNKKVLDMHIENAFMFLKLKAIRDDEQELVKNAVNFIFDSLKG